VEPGPAQRHEVAEAAHVLARLGLVTAFGHVSMRTDATGPVSAGGTATGPASAGAASASHASAGAAPVPVGASMLITPAADLATVTESALVEVALDANVLPAGAPAETWAHLALYRARPDAAAIARAQPPSSFAAAACTRSLPVLHGQAAWLGESVPVHDDARLLRSAGLADHAARGLPAGEALLLRGNGALTLGTAPGLAVARMWLLAAACDVFLAARAAGEPTPLGAGEIASWRAAGGELLPRLWQHLRRTSQPGPSG
jgi:HCOMODA/2-hydroxy-3-carboxy-muconic semialdehyde decarboxylase